MPVPLEQAAARLSAGERATVVTHLRGFPARLGADPHSINDRW
jgi:hypothetical protein